MNMFKRKEQYKSKDPYTTIQEIRDILFKCNIFLKESSFYHERSDTYAYELRFGDHEFIKENARIATNGKGMDSRFALASAYGEMAERIQCGGLLSTYQRKAYQAGDINYESAPDEKEICLSDLNEESKDGIKLLLNMDDGIFLNVLEKYKETKVNVVPFYDAINDKVVDLPWSLFFSFIGTNGMCAGNDSSEAIAQGLNELFERDSLMRIYRDNQELPILKKEIFKGNSITEKLNHLESLGFTCEILDASMGMDYPVIGLRLRNEKGLLFTLGADPDPVVALERCLTEMFQTITSEGVDKRFCKENIGFRRDCSNLFELDYYHWQYSRAKTLGSGDKPDNIYNSSDVLKDTFRVLEGADDLSKLMGLVKRCGYHLYVRDTSYLGFPAFILFIPEISMADFLYEQYPDALERVLTNNYSLKEPKAYDAGLRVVKGLMIKYENNIPDQNKLKEVFK